MRSKTTSLRLSQPEIQLIDRGLDLILYRASDLSLQNHDSGLLAYIKEVAGELARVSKRPSATTTHRLHLDALGCAMCMSAVRIFGREFRRGRIPGLTWPTGINHGRLLKKLERHRKRAKRKWIHFGDPAAYRDWAIRWRRFLGWVRESLRPIRVRCFEFYRRYFELIVPIVKRALTDATNEPLPPERELRKLIRVMLRHVRRERAPITMRDVLSCTEQGRDFIVYYMMKLIVKSRPENPSAARPNVPLLPTQTA